MAQFTRRVIGFAAQSGDVDETALCHMFNQAIARKGTPEYLSSGNDPLFEYHQLQQNLGILDIEGIKASVAYTNFRSLRDQ